MSRFRRVDRGNGHTYFDGQTKIEGVTTIINGGVPKPQLIDWAATTTAQYAADNWDELSGYSITERYEKLRRARWEVTDTAALRGKDLHDIFERVVLGSEVALPERLEQPARTLTEFIDRWNLQPVLTETPVLHREFGYAGTLDIVADLADGRRWLLDLKTGKGVYADAVLQLAAYRNAEVYIGDDGEEHPMPDVDRCGVIHLTVDDCRLHPVDAGQRAFLVFRHAYETHKWQRATTEAFKSRSGWPIAPAIDAPEAA